MFHRKTSSSNSLGGRKVSPPQPTCMTAEQKSNYLDNLRNNRPARPTGSRPAPFSPRNYGSLTSQSILSRSDSAPVIPSVEDGPKKDDEAVHPGMQKSMSFSSSMKGRPLAQPPGNEPPRLFGRKVSPTAIVDLPHLADQRVYVESAARQLEKEEAHSLREALHQIDHKDDELKIYEAAKDEAADLVWKHQNPKAAEAEEIAPYRNPDLKAKERRRSSGHRHASGARKVSFPTPESRIYEEPEELKDAPRPTIQPPSAELPLRAKSRNKLPWLRSKTVELPDPEALLPQGKKYDRFEIHKNPPSQSRKADYTANTPPRPPVINTIEEVDTPNSRGSLEIRGDDIRAATSMKRKDRSPNLPTPTAVSDQVGRPIVSFNPAWRPPSDSPRTSQDFEGHVTKLPESPLPAKEDRGSLPRPMAEAPEICVSAPMVPSINLPDEQTPSRPLPDLTMSAPAVPTIQFPDEAPHNTPAALPTINLPDDGQACPVINVHSVESPRPLPKIGVRNDNQRTAPSRPLPKHSSSAPIPSNTTIVKTPSTRLPWLNSRQSMPTVSCSSCSLPISGRIVTASGSNSQRDLKARFHPECFTCHHCDTPLECVSFYPEPDASRLERLGVFNPSESDEPLSSDDVLILQNDPLRFYCHLDFHEFFSPRCRSCKTPIEGEIVVACGHSYHVDHFFCAECGDPFSSTTPFVEGSDGYAYCVRCHTRRTSARCKGCKAPILDEVTVEAIGGKWHENCFVCLECGGGFGDEGRFFVREVEGELTDKERRRGMTTKFEERAVCGGCEERRLKA